MVMLAETVDAVIGVDTHTACLIDGTGREIREALRILLVARDQANTTRTAAVNLFKSLLMTAPDQLRESLRRLSAPRQTTACAVLRVDPRDPAADRVRRQTLRSLAQRIRLLDKEIRANERDSPPHPEQVPRPGLRPFTLPRWSDHPARRPTPPH